MTARREKSKPQKPQLNKQLEAEEQKPKMENTWIENLGKYLLDISKKEKRRSRIMGMYLIFFVYGVPCILFLLFCLTPSGKQWLRQHNML